MPRPVVKKTRDRIPTLEEAGARWNALRDLRSGQGATFPVCGDILSLQLLTGAPCRQTPRLGRSASRLPKARRPVLSSFPSPRQAVDVHGRVYDRALRQRSAKD